MLCFLGSAACAAAVAWQNCSPESSSGQACFGTGQFQGHFLVPNVRLKAQTKSSSPILMAWLFSLNLSQDLWLFWRQLPAVTI